MALRELYFTRTEIYLEVRHLCGYSEPWAKKNVSYTLGVLIFVTQ